MESMPQRPLPPKPLGETVIAWLRWFGVARLIVTVLAVVAVAGGGYWLLRSPPTPVENSLPYASAGGTVAPGSSPSDTTTGGGGDPTTIGSGADGGSGDGAVATTTVVPSAPVSIVVYVAGAVSVAGVYELPVGARVQTAVEAAGGLTADADVGSLNLAAHISDGDRVFVPVIGQAVPSIVAPTGATPTVETSGGVPTPVAPLDLNQATAAQLDELPGVGPSTAAAIVAHRETSGPYASVDDLLDVRGIGPSKLESIRPLVTV